MSTLPVLWMDMAPFTFLDHELIPYRYSSCCSYWSDTLQISQTSSESVLKWQRSSPRRRRTRTRWVIIWSQFLIENGEGCLVCPEHTVGGMLISISRPLSRWLVQRQSQVSCWGQISSRSDLKRWSLRSFLKSVAPTRTREYRYWLSS